MKFLLHKFIYHLVRVLIFPYVKWRYGFRTDHVPEMDEPFLMISNHTTEDDMFFTGLAERRHMYFVCGEHLLRNKVYGKALRVLADPIPLPKGGASIDAIREIRKRIGEGYNICLFPEGKRSFHGETIPSGPALGKLVKLTGAALVTYRIRGGYFTYPRWARDHRRRGHAAGKVVGVYHSQDLKNLSAQEITDIINRDTYENAYAVQRKKMWKYRGKDLAKGMEQLLFLCPSCGAMDTVRTEGDGFFCTSCGMRGIYNEYGFLEGENLPFDNVRSWMRWIEPRFDRYVREKEGTLLFTEPDVRLYRMLENYENEDILTGTLSIFEDRMEIGDFVFPFGEIPYMSLLFGNILLFSTKTVPERKPSENHAKLQYLGLTGENFRAWKCARLWHLACGDTGDRSKEI